MTIYSSCLVHFFSCVVAFFQKHFWEEMEGTGGLHSAGDAQWIVREVGYNVLLRAKF